MTSNNDAIQDKLNAIKTSYIKSLPDKINAIFSCWDAVSQQWDTVNFKEFHRLIHSLAGSGATFGFEELGKQCREIEHHILTITHENHIVSHEEKENIRKMLHDLKWIAGEEESQAKPEEQLVEKITSPADTHDLLLVNDDKDYTDELAIELKKYGYNPTVVNNLAQLEEIYTTAKTNAIIMDIMHPDGQFSGAKQIKKLQQSYTIPTPVIFISSRNDLRARLEAVRAGSFAFFTKPIDIKSLIEALDTIIIPKKTPYRIMIIDDDVNLSEHYATVLQLAGMEVITINNPEHCIKCLSEFQPELIMMDMYMPNYTGIELAKVIRQLGTHNNTPIVFLSSEPDLDKQFAALDVGGDAFLTKPIVDKHLIMAVHAKVQRARLLASLIVRDSLTGLINNAKIKEELYTEITRAERNHASLSFVMLDIDNFKTVNDTYGHMTGDRVLITLSRLLQEDLRNSDHIGRYGGEEFAIILPATDMPKATYILDRIRKSFEKIRHHHESGSFTCTFSAGIAFFPKHKKVNELIESADKALYKAKDGGRNRIEQFLS